MVYATFDGSGTIRETEEFTHPLPVAKGKPGTLVVTSVTVVHSGGLTLRGYDQATRMPARCLSNVTAMGDFPESVQAAVHHVHASLRTAEDTIKGDLPS